MSLDGFGRCACIRDGKARPHPFPDRPIFDESGGPRLTGDRSEQEWEADDPGPGESYKHEGYLLSLFLGNITEVDTVLHSSDVLEDSEKEFFNNMKLLCETSVATGNPVMF